MGDVADAMLDGDLCQVCGVYMEGGAGYPQTCHDCLRDMERSAPRTEKVVCSVCGKKVKEVGMHDHMKDKHRARVTEANRGTKP